MVSVTSAMPSGLRSRVPAKITSCIWVPRRDLALCSPSTQLTPSRMFDLPHPLGPTTTAMPVPPTVSSVRSQKLLKPRMWIFFSFSMSTPGVVRARLAPAQPGGIVPYNYRLYGAKEAGSTYQQAVYVDKKSGIQLSAIYLV